LHFDEGLVEESASSAFCFQLEKNEEAAKDRGAYLVKTKRLHTSTNCLPQPSVQNQIWSRDGSSIHDSLNYFSCGSRAYHVKFQSKQG
jgi:hypothetical protein